MQVQILSLHSYRLPLTNGIMRCGIWLRLVTREGNISWGDVAPLPSFILRPVRNCAFEPLISSRDSTIEKGASIEEIQAPFSIVESRGFDALKCAIPDRVQYSRESLKDALEELEQKREQILAIDWTLENCLETLEQLDLLPSSSFGLESALLSLLDPLPGKCVVPTSALLMGSCEEIQKCAELRHREGYTSAKLKVNQLSLQEAARLIHALKGLFRLRIDVNRAWTTADSLQFFSQFSLDTFDYVEEPFQNPHDLAQFPHPLAIDESFPRDLSLEQLSTLPTLKALIYKPTIQGGMLPCLHLQKWADERSIALVLSSSFESIIGLGHIASLAQRLQLLSPIGIGTYHYLDTALPRACNTPDSC